MTRRLLLIGNSHIAALKFAYEADPARWPGITLHIAGARGKLMRKTEVRDGVLWPTDPETRTAFKRLGGHTNGVRFTDYDLLGIVGLLCVNDKFSTIHRTARTRQFPSAAEGFDKAFPILMSPAAFAALALDKARTGRIASLLGPIRAATDMPIACAPQPFPHESVLSEQGDGFSSLCRIEAMGDSEEMARVFHRANTELAAEHDAVYVRQPEETLARPMFTKTRFMDASRRLAVGAQLHKSDDRTHANDAYGALMLDAVVRGLGLDVAAPKAAASA